MGSGSHWNNEYENEDKDNDKDSNEDKVNDKDDNEDQDEDESSGRMLTWAGGRRSSSWKERWAAGQREPGTAKRS